MTGSQHKRHSPENALCAECYAVIWETWLFITRYQERVPWLGKWNTSSGDGDCESESLPEISEDCDREVSEVSDSDSDYEPGEDLDEFEQWDNANQDDRTVSPLDKINEENIEASAILYELKFSSLRTIPQQCFLCSYTWEQLFNHFPAAKSAGMKQSPNPSNRFSGKSQVVPLTDTDEVRVEFQLERVVGLNWSDFFPSEAKVEFHLKFRQVDEAEVVSEHYEEQSLDDRWPVARDWIENCLANHPCATSSGTSWIPTRLIDIGMWQDDVPYLVERKEVPTDAEYVSLSHCWGHPGVLQSCKLLQDNFESLRKKIDNLPKTFSDAIQVARQLGKRYIWIDSLCIIQNSERDWLSEAAKMGEVYRHSFCNIAALGAVDATEGLFLAQDSTHASPWYIGLPDDEQGLPRILEISIASAIRQDFSTASLLGRAWVMQERMLAPPNFWECREVYDSELVKNLRLKPSISEEQDGDIVVKSSWAAATAVDREQLYSQWANAVRHYTTCSLTHPRDKLIAISGYANFLASSLNDHYVAGLWKSDFLRGLLWSSKEDYFALNQRPKHFRAPSWSWASIDGRVIYHDIGFETNEEQQSLAEMSSVDVKTVDGEVSGPLIAGSAKLTAWLLPLSIEAGPVQSNKSASWATLKPLANQDIVLHGSRNLALLVRWDTVQDQHQGQGGQETSFFLPILLVSRRCYGLVLVACGTSSALKDQEFRRVGRLEAGTKGEAILSRLKELQAAQLLHKESITLY